MAKRGFGSQDQILGDHGFFDRPKSPAELKGHIRGAINNDASVQEIQEVLLHSLPYCGAPAAQEAYRAAADILDEMGVLEGFEG